MFEEKLISRFIECGCEPELARKLAAIAMEEIRNIPVRHTPEPKPQPLDIAELINVGAQAFDAYQTKRAAETLARLQNESMQEIEEMKLLMDIDKREKIFRAAISMAAIGALVAVVVWVERADSVVPVLTLIIGLLFKNSSFSEIVSFRKSKHAKSVSE